MRRFQINNMSDSCVFLTYDEVVEFGAYLRTGQRLTCDNIYSELIEHVVFRYTDSEIAIFIQYGIEPTDDPIIVDVYNAKDNTLIFSGDHLDESVLPEPTEEYIFQESIEVVAEVIRFPLPEGMKGTDKYVVVPEIRSDADRLRDLADSIDGTIGKRIVLSGIPCDIDTKELLTFTLEKDESRYRRGLDVLKSFEMENVTLLNDDAFTFLQEYQDKKYPKFDYIFLDAGKKDYLSYLPIIDEIIAQGGFLICDNTFFNGKVAIEEDQLTKSYIKSVPLLKKFNIELGKSNLYNTSYFWIGDGMSLSIRK